MLCDLLAQSQTTARAADRAQGARRKLTRPIAHHATLQGVVRLGLQHDSARGAYLSPGEAAAVRQYDASGAVVPPAAVTLLPSAQKKKPGGAGAECL